MGKTNNWHCLSFAATLCFSATNSYADIDFRVGAGLKTGDYELEGGTFFKDAEGDINLAVINGTIIGSGGYYVDLSYGSSSEDAEFENGFKSDFDYDETTITLGQANENGFIWFVGYKDTESKYKYSQGGLAFEADGIFAGAAKAFALGPGTANVSAALAFMEGGFDYSFGAVAFKADADLTAGYSLGIGYNYPITDNLSVSVDYKYQWYEYDMTSSSASISDAIVETLSTFGLMVLYKF